MERVGRHVVVRPKRLCSEEWQTVMRLLKDSGLPYFEFKGKILVFFLPDTEALWVLYRPYGPNGPVRYRHYFLPREFGR